MKSNDLQKQTRNMDSIVEDEAGLTRKSGLIMNPEISKSATVDQKQFSCENVIRKIRVQFLNVVEKGAASSQLLKYSQVCLDFVRNNQYESTISKILAVLKSLGVPDDEMKLPQGTQNKLDEVIKFDHSLKDEYSKLGIEQLFAMPQKTTPLGQRLTISGAFVRLEDLNVDKTVELIEIQALLEVAFAPKEYNLHSSVSIMSPRWKIDGDVSFDLHGQDGQNYSSRAKDGLDLTLPQNFYLYGSEELLKKSVAQDGLPGRPGKGPSFFGLGKLAYSNSECQFNLTATGGNGGNGQDAGNGSNFSIYQLRAHGNYQKYYGVPLQKLSESVVEAFSGKIGGGAQGCPGELQYSFLRTDKVNFNLSKKKGNRGLDGNKGKPGLIQFQFMDPIPGKVVTEIVPAGDESRHHIVGYDTIVRYENSLIEHLSGKGVLKDIAYRQLMDFISTDFSKRFQKQDQPYSSFQLTHFIGEMNVIAKLYNKFLFEQDFLTPELMTELVKAFKKKFAGYINSSYQMNSNEEKLAIKIATFILIIERNLKMAHGVLDFDYLNSFLGSPSQIIPQDIDINYQSQYILRYLKLNIQNVVSRIQSEFNQFRQKYKKALNEQDRKQYSEKLAEQLPIFITTKMLELMGKVLGYLDQGRQALNQELRAPEMLHNSVLTSLEKNYSFNPAQYIGADNRLDLKKALLQIEKLQQFYPDLKQTKKNTLTIESMQNYLIFAQNGLTNKVNEIGLIYYNINEKKELEKLMKQPNISGMPDEKWKFILQNQWQATNHNESEAQVNKKIKNAFLQRQTAKKILNAVMNVSIANAIVIITQTCLDSVEFVAKALKNHEDFMIQLTRYDNFIGNTIQNFVHKISYVNQLPEATLQAPSLFLEYGFKGTLKNVLEFFKNSQQKSKHEYQNQIYNLFINLQNKTRDISQIYSLIENYKSQDKLSKLIVDACKPLKERLFGIAEMERNLDKLVIHRQANKMLNTFKQSAFPSQPYYSYETYNRITNTYRDASMKDFMKNLQDLYKNHRLNKKMIGQRSGQFVKTDQNAVFFTYDGEYEIGKLLQGQTISILSDVRLSPKDRDVIKFTDINIRFELKPGATEQVKNIFEKIERFLFSNCSVEMTCSGNYFYRYGQTYYNLPSSQLSLQRQYDPKGRLADKSVMMLVRDGEAMFSPYTSWKLTLFISYFDITEDIKKCLSQLQLTFYGTAVYLDSQASAKIPAHDCYKSFEANILTIVPKA